MAEFLEIIKVTGPAIAIAVWLAFALWKENGQLQAQNADDTKRYEGIIFGLYERLVAAEKENTLNLLRFCTSQPTEQVPRLVAKYVEELSRQMEDVKKQIDTLKEGTGA